MAKGKKAKEAGFVMFDVLYDDGTRTSNRKVATTEIDEFDEDGSIKAAIESQDRKIAEMSGRVRGTIKSISRSPTR